MGQTDDSNTTMVELSDLQASNQPGRRPPIFIVGCERSGTTLLQALIDAHPHIAIPPESDLYNRFACVLPYYGDLRDEQNLRTFVTDFLNDWKVLTWAHHFGVDDVLEAIRSPDWPGVIDAVFSLYAAEHNAVQWGDKTPANAFYLNRIWSDFPEARVLHIIRDARDVTESLLRMKWREVSMARLAHVWCDTILAVHESAANMPPGSLLEIRYEDLVTEPLQVLAAVFKFLHVPFVDTSLTYESSDLSARYAAMHPCHVSLRGGVKASKIGAHRSGLTSRQVELIESIAGPIMASLGYPLRFVKPRPPTRPEKFMSHIVECVHHLCLKASQLKSPKLHGQHRLRLLRQRLKYELRAVASPLKRS